MAHHLISNWTFLKILYVYKIFHKSNNNYVHVPFLDIKVQNKIEWGGRSFEEE